MSDSVTVLVGTTKGAFLLRSDTGRAVWTVSGPHCDGAPVNHAAADPATGTLWAGGGDSWSGAGVWRSDDDGASWTRTPFSSGEREAFIAADPETAAQLGFTAGPPAPFDGEVDSIWSLALAGDTLWAGGRPGKLYRSRDRGTTWEPVSSLNDAPDRDSWNPGAAGLTLHTIVAAPDDPDRMWIGISAAGVFATEDGGATWERRNRRANAIDTPATHPAGGTSTEIGYCVHNAVRAPGGEGDLLYQQNHHGTWRSNDGGRSWQSIGAGLPSTFGFPIAVHPRDPRTLWVLPLNGDSAGRFPPDASAAVWKSTDGGDSWAPRQSGLPAENCFFTVLRQAMTTDRGTPAGVYFGTNSGSVFASTDEGESWSEIARHLPTVLCVEYLHRT